MSEKDVDSAEPAVSGGRVVEACEANSQTKLKSRHLYMIAIGGKRHAPCCPALACPPHEIGHSPNHSPKWIGCVGTAFLVGSGRTLSQGGPAFTLAGFVTICFMVWVFSTLLFEMATFMPLDGAAPDYYTTRFLSRSFGFALGWNYWYAYSILVPFEITVATLIIHYWNPPVHDAVWISIFLVVIVGLNYLPVANSGEAEFAFSSLKLTMLAGLIILAIVLAAGGGPSGERIGFKYWNDPGPANAWLVEGSSGLFVSFLGVIVSVVLPVWHPHPVLPTAATM